MDNPNFCLITFMLRRYNLFVGHTLTLKRTPIYIRYRNTLFSSTYMRYLEFVAVVQLISCVWFFATPWTAAHQASLSITNSPSFLKLISIKLVQPSNHLVLLALLFLPSIFLSIRVFANESALCIRWPKYWSFSFSICPSYEYLGLISFRMDWLDLLAVQGTLKNLLQHHCSKASILWRSASLMVQFSHPYMTIGNAIALIIWPLLAK